MNEACVSGPSCLARFPIGTRRAGDGSGLSGGDRKIKLIISFYVKYDG